MQTLGGGMIRVRERVEFRELCCIVVRKLVMENERDRKKSSQSDANPSILHWKCAFYSMGKWHLVPPLLVWS